MQIHTAKHGRVTVTSYGRGTAYCLQHDDGREVFFQCDDAIEFESEMESRADASCYADALESIMADYT